MASKYVVTKGTKVSISKETATTVNPTGGTWLAFDCITTEVSYTGGAKSDIDVTTLCSLEKENINGLADPGEIGFTGNWVKNDDAQKALHQAYLDDTLHAFRIVLPDGTGYAFLGEVRQENFTISTDAVITGGFTVRMKGQLEDYTETP